MMLYHSEGRRLVVYQCMVPSTAWQPVRLLGHQLQHFGFAEPIVEIVVGLLHFTVAYQHFVVADHSVVELKQQFDLDGLNLQLLCQVAFG
jgi:hypothetical protein